MKSIYSASFIIATCLGALAGGHANAQAANSVVSLVCNGVAVAEGKGQAQGSGVYKFQAPIQIEVLGDQPRQGVFPLSHGNDVICTMASADPNVRFIDASATLILAENPPSIPNAVLSFGDKPTTARPQAKAIYHWTIREGANERGNIQFNIIGIYR